MFNGLGQPVGAQITNYLLEKVSIVTQIRLTIRIVWLAKSRMSETSTSSTNSQKELVLRRKVSCQRLPPPEEAKPA
jgi:hypothetical protein